MIYTEHLMYRHGLLPDAAAATGTAAMPGSSLAGSVQAGCELAAAAAAAAGGVTPSSGCGITQQQQQQGLPMLLQQQQQQQSNPASTDISRSSSHGAWTLTNANNVGSCSSSRWQQQQQHEELLQQSMQLLRMSSVGMPASMRVTPYRTSSGSSSLGVSSSKVRALVTVGGSFE
jgi:hypothetical protein